MNNKRQTIWLVSMLSLMVILSAYYLFTDDSGTKAPPVAESTQVDGQKPGAGQEANGTAGDELVVNEVLEEGTDGDSGANEQGTGTTDTGVTGTEDPAEATQGEQDDQGKAAGEADKPQEPEVKESTDGADKSKDASSTGKDEAEPSKDTSSTSGEKSDKEVLEEVAANATSAVAQLDSYKLDRAQKNNKLYDELMTKIDNHENKPEETAQATQQLKAAEAKEEVILSIEETLQQQFGNAVVKEESEKYNVVVLSEKLDAKGAADIVSLVMKELKVSPDKVTVQYVAP
ncbi:SpoIIIAH-like family protein [Paenibacillus lautus]|uniref:Mutants block sporulation after engulfment (Stage III sporulation) n=1 Tax=Paenibacillus lautus TaxID=1401 RepID=A0A385TQA8_PAELA|nr:SpoIIIAH-like family protein [Paenibacillus lautus]AYB45278.1 mutants block sporulation after engulfment (stage III sporulation) [Paenibacillus lautus]MBY0160345.1 SpoIIIAH-like family protein [Cytobacillus firmus]MCI1775360.1 SpoIIIAH-like family protein [Paenibacillus lautus]VTR55089.1 Stage III sporulation protein AH [Actinobacillus pleuropneumoniae]